MQNIIDLLETRNIDDAIQARLLIAKMFRLRRTIKLLEALILIYPILPLCAISKLSATFDDNDIDGIIRLMVINHGERAQEIIELL